MVPHQRIIGARLLAGFMSGVDVADELGLSKSKYQKLEKNLVGLNAVDRAALAKLFDVSEQFLADGQFNSDRDRSAARLAEILTRAGDASPTGAQERLIAVRTKRGFRSARSAAVHFGWNEQTYGAHERGNITLPTERLIGYALGYEVRPEYLVYGNEPVEPSSKEVIEGWADRRAVKQKSLPTSAINWRWLKKQAADTVTLPLAEISGNRLVQSKLRPMVLPIQAFSGPPITPYGIVIRPEGGGIQVVVVDPSAPQKDSVVVLAAGSLEIVPVKKGPPAIVDPLSIAAKDSETLVLGSQIRKVSIG